MSGLRAVAPLVVAATLAIAAGAAAGLEPSPASPIPDSAFGPVQLDRGAIAGAIAAAPVPTPSLQPLADPLPPSPPPAERPQPSLPTPKAITVQATSHSISGRASWYCNYDNPNDPHSICVNRYPDGPGMDAYAAAGPGLRAALGADWRGQRVVVCGRRCVAVRLVDWCKCTGGSVGVEKLIDLYNDVYVLTGSKVTIRW